MKPIIVIGSSNTDMVVKAAKLPGPGETVLGGSFLMTPGGKGANQAMAAQRLSRGSQVVFIAKVGDDVFGEEARRGFEAEGMDTRFVLRDFAVPSGVALIGVDDRGENSIMVAPGANARLSAQEVKQALADVEEPGWMLLQLEIPLETVREGILSGFAKGYRVVLNPAPAQAIPEDLYPCLHLITPNETEASLLTGFTVTDEASAAEAAKVLLEKGVENVIVTLGSRGAYLRTADAEWLVPAPAVKPLDTTAAGDIFNGALVVALAEQRPLPEAMAFACQAAALSVTRMGAQASIPRRAEVDELMDKT